MTVWVLPSVAVEQLAIVDEGGTLQVQLTPPQRLSPKERPTFVRVCWPDAREDFYVAKYEVTNGEFQEFVDAGCYSNRAFWKHEFEPNGKTIAWEDGIRLLCDATARPGPATWQGGHNAQGERDFPVRGVSWYEAAAYAEFRGQSLLPIDAWERAASLEDVSFILPLSKFSDAIAGAGSRGAMSRFGVIDMFGNVKEWCMTPTADGRRYARGGAWDEPSYTSSHLEALAPLTRMPNLGFRCARFRLPPVEAAVAIDMARPAAALPAKISREKLERFIKFYADDQNVPLNAKTLRSDDGAPELSHETVEIDAAYRDPALVVYDEAFDLQNRILPKNNPRAIARKAEYARFAGSTAFLGLRLQLTDRAKQQRAVEIVQRALARDLPPALLWRNLACAHYAMGNLGPCRQALDKALEQDAARSDHWFLAALVSAREGKTDEAWDWYLSGDEWLRRDPPSVPVFTWFKGLAAAQLKVPQDTRASDDPAEHIARYDRLLSKYPRVGILYSTTAAACGTASGASGQRLRPTFIWPRSTAPMSS